MATEMWDAVLFIIALCRNAKRMQLFCLIDFDPGGGGGGGGHRPAVPRTGVGRSLLNGLAAGYLWVTGLFVVALRSSEIRINPLK